MSVFSELSTFLPDAIPRPTLSVFSHGPVSKLYVTEKQNVEIVCSINSTYLKTQDYVSHLKPLQWIVL